MSLLGRGAAIAVLMFSAFFVSSCGKTVIDDVKTEDALEQNVERSLGRKVTAVDCPSGVEVEKGKTFECVLTLAGGKEETATVMILNEDADVEVTRLEPSK